MPIEKKDGTFKLAEILEDNELKYLYHVKENSMKLKEILKGHNGTKLSEALDKAEDMTPEIGKKMGRPDLGAYGQKKKGEGAQAEDKVKAKKKESDDDLQRVNKDADVEGPLRRWSEPTRITTIVKEAEDFLKKGDDDCGDDDEREDVGAAGSDDKGKKEPAKDEKKKGDEDMGTMGNEPKIAEVLRQAEDMTPEVGKKMKRDDLGKYGRKGWEKEVKTDGEAPKVSKGEARLQSALQRYTEADQFKYTGNADKDFTDEHPLIPDLAIETAVEKHRGVEPEDVETVADIMKKKFKDVYKANSSWGKQILNGRGNTGRDMLYTFVNHWVDAYLAKR